MIAERGNWSGSPWKWKLEMFSRRHLGKLDEGGVGGNVGGIAAEHHRAVGVGGSDIGVAVGQSLHQPGGFEIHEDRPVVRGATGRQHAHHAQLDRVGAGNVEDVLRVRHEPVAGSEFQATPRCRRRGHSRPIPAVARRGRSGAHGRRSNPGWCPPWGRGGRCSAHKGVWGRRNRWRGWRRRPPCATGAGRCRGSRARAARGRSGCQGRRPPTGC